MENLLIRSELASDKDAIYQLNSLAFAGPEEAELINKVREVGQLALSMVALHDNKLLAHVLYTPVEVEHNLNAFKVWGLGPVAVLPEVQRQGIGKALIRASLAKAHVLAADAIVLLGHTSYYPQFGFKPASNYQLSFQGQDFGDAFMALELRPGVLAKLSGKVQYVSAFHEGV